MYTMEGKPLCKALQLFESPDIPAWGEAEAPLDPPCWPVSQETTPQDHPGGGLARHPMLWVGENDNRMYLVHHGKIIWTYDAGKGWEYDDVWMRTDGNILFSHMYWVGLISPDKRFVWRMDTPAGC